VKRAVRHWLAIAGLSTLFAAHSASAQSTLLNRAPLAPPEPPSRSFDIRVTETPARNPSLPSVIAIVADTEIMPNARFGLGLITLSRPKLGPEFRVDGRSIRHRKPAVSFTFRF
jgi:hypothetical protein